MAVDMSRMRKDRKKADKPKRDGVDILKFEEKEYLLYICPPVHDEDPIPYVEAQAHFGLGPNKRMVINCDGLEGHAPFVAALGRKPLPGGSVEEGPHYDWSTARAGWKVAERYAAKHRANKRIQLKDRWYFGAVIIATRTHPHDEWDLEDAPPYNVISAGKTIYEGITDAFFDVGDITDPDKAVFIKIRRTGQGLDTKYSVTTDTDTLRKPAQIDDDLWERLEALLVPNGDGDLYKLLAQFVRTAEQVEDILEGRDGNDEEKGSSPPRRSAPAVAAKPASARRRRRAEPEEEPEEEPEVEAEAEPEEEPEAKPSRRRRKKVEAEDGGDDESSVSASGADDVAELDAALKSRSRRRRRA